MCSRGRIEGSSSWPQYLSTIYSNSTDAIVVRAWPTGPSFYPSTTIYRAYYFINETKKRDDLQNKKNLNNNKDALYLDSPLWWLLLLLLLVPVVYFIVKRGHAYHRRRQYEYFTRTVLPSMGMHVAPPLS
eukprot:TRINITY_DN26348_c0_g1_i1.p1 TRINITY_DN26348_c0_g1~~TRINITY_DN26348_c0_g1_i1.p1  ORF type:complete len:130 (-),score=18.96 TRINITY_DN26348_c0_g1_i1:9-398(-)